MKKLIFLLLLVFFFMPIHSQEAENEYNDAHDFEKAENFISFIHSLDFVGQMEPGMYFNMESTLVSAPSPVIFPLTIGILWPNYTVFAIQPSLSFFVMEHLWYNGRALPAEIENRTTTTMSFLLTLPLVFSLYFPKSRIQLLPGISLLGRVGLLSNGVKPQDKGFSGTAKQDSELINGWFWNDMNYMYLSAGFSWLINLQGNLKAGPVLNLYIPINMISSGTGLQDAIISAGLKFSL